MVHCCKSKVYFRIKILDLRLANPTIIFIFTINETQRDSPALQYRIGWALCNRRKQCYFFNGHSKCIKIQPHKIPAAKEEILTGEKLSILEKVLIALASGKPIQYVLGEAHFYGLNFKVDESVLIPRPETEELVQWVIESANDHIDNNQDINILDVGTGSGCIAIALKKNLLHSKVDALDIAADSLKIAEQNATLNQVQVNFIEMDILHAPIEVRIAPYHIIVSNPPYIKTDEQADMHANVLAHEPHRALFVSNEQPLLFYEAIADFALLNLIKHGLLFFEINAALGQEAIDLLKYKGFNNIELRKDMQGNDRMIRCIKGQV